MRSKAELAEVTRAAVAAAAGAVRRMIVTRATSAIWQLAGFRMPNGSTETLRAEVFGGIGLFAIPPAGNKPEAIVIMVGPDDSKAPAIIAVRDEKTRAAIAGALEADETALFNSQAIVHLKADGTIEARSEGGVALPLATKADIDALTATFNAHFHTGVVVGGAFSGPPATPAAAAIGTTVVKGE